MLALLNMNWAKLGRELRESADDAHGLKGKAPLNVRFAYQFLLDNPECFSDHDEWPQGMPQEPVSELIAAYYGAI